MHVKFLNAVCLALPSWLTASLLPLSPSSALLSSAHNIKLPDVLYSLSYRHYKQKAGVYLALDFRGACEIYLCTFFQRPCTDVRQHRYVISY